MFCRNCGKEIDDKAEICPHCGVRQTAPVTAQEETKRVNGLGIAGFVVGLVSLWLGVYFCIASIVGLVLSAVAFSKRDKYSLKGLTLAGLILSIVSLVLWALVLIIAAATVGAGGGGTFY